MTRKSVEFELKANTKAAQRDLKKTAQAVDDVADALDDTESAGKQLARAMQTSADRMIDEIDDTARAVEALERALGPDFDADTRDVVSDLKQLGLTAGDVEEDADELAAALRRAGDVKTHAAAAGFDDVGQAVGSVRDETGKTRDTMTGFIGGTVGELPGISEAMGPVAEGLGQLTEGALEGEIGFKQMAAAGAGIAVAAFVLKEVTGHLEKIRKIKAFREDQVEGYNDALDDAESTIDAIRDKLEEAGGIFANYFGDEEDLTAGFAALGVGVDEFSRLVRGGDDQIDLWAQSLRDAGVDSDTVAQAVDVLKSEVSYLEKAQDGAAASLEFFGDEADDTAESIDDISDAYADLYGLLDDSDAILDVADAFDDVEQASNDAWLAAATGADDAERKARDHQRSVNDLKRDVYSYAEEVRDIPPEAVSDIIALIDEGRLQEAENKLSDLERTRQAILDVTVRGADGWFVTQANGVRIKDVGGPVGSGRMAMIAEKRPEIYNGQLVTQPSIVTGPGSVTSGAQTEQRLAAGRGGGDTFVTVLAPAGINVRDLSRRSFRRTGRPS